MREKDITDQLKSKNTVCIGITPWNKTKNHLELLGEDARSEYQMPQTHNVQDAYLDNNHTNFLMLDNNYAENNSKVIDFSASLITGIKKLQHEGIIPFFMPRNIYLGFSCETNLLIYSIYFMEVTIK